VVKIPSQNECSIACALNAAWLKRVEEELDLSEEGEGAIEAVKKLIGCHGALDPNNWAEFVRGRKFKRVYLTLEPNPGRFIDPKILDDYDMPTPAAAHLRIHMEFEA
jgi:hypothetical protein